VAQLNAEWEIPAALPKNSTLARNEQDVGYAAGKVSCQEGN